MTVAALNLTLQASGQQQSYIFLSAPSVNEHYYRPKFDELTKFYRHFISKTVPGDRAILVADADTIAAFEGQIHVRHLIEGKSRDIWVRDSGVITTVQGIFKPSFRPNYLSPSDAAYIENGFLDWFGRLHIPFERLPLVLDGGNFCHNGAGRSVTTVRVLADNPNLSEKSLRDLVQDRMGIGELAILPEVPGDTTGHSDGMVKWLSQNTIGVNQFDDPAFLQNVIGILTSTFPGVDVVTVPYKPTDKYWRGFADSTGIYVNAVTTPNAVYVPLYGLKADTAALEVFRKHSDRPVVGVQVSPEIAIMGGAARCLSCQVYGPATAAGKIPGDSPPRLKVKRMKNGASRGRQFFLHGTARDVDGIKSVHCSGGTRSVRAKVRQRSGRWFARLRAGNSSRRASKVTVIAVDETGSIAVKRARIQVR